MAIKVDNLNNLFWDNGSSRFPNTHPYLINGEYLENVTPVMTSPFAGWVVLTGDFNYCEYKGELFFLKKDVRISESKNKWRYILIKDHICSIFKNKANVLATGTLTTASLDKLSDTDFQFTLSPFNNFNNRILLPLNKQIYNWKKHIIPVLPRKIFEDVYTIDNRNYSIFLRELELTKQATTKVKFEESKHFTLLGRAKTTKKVNNWKNQLVLKIKQLLQNLDDEDIILARFTDRLGDQKFLQGKYVITHSSYSLGTHKEEFKQVLNLDLSKLEDIVLISLTTGLTGDITTNFNNVTLKEIPVDESREWTASPYIKKLTRTNRTSFGSPYYSRAIYERDGKLRSWASPDDNQITTCPQKVFIKTTPSLLAKAQWQRKFPLRRKLESYRSVYLYSVKDLNYVYQINEDASTPTENAFKELNFIDPNIYLQDTSNKSLANNSLFSYRGIKAVKPKYYDYGPWNRIKEPLNIGWLIGQYSVWLKGPNAIDYQEDYFYKDKPFIVKKPFTKLNKITGLKKQVGRLIQNQDAYEPSLIRDERTYDFTLDCFCKLPPRARQATNEADFLIGEKLLFTTWGLGSYLLFQPVDKGEPYFYSIDKLDKDNTLINRWVNVGSGSWFYYYDLFDEGNYVTDWAKQWLKMAYSNFEPLHYRRYYESPSAYQELKTHIRSNTNAFFYSGQEDFSKTPIVSCRQGDIFFSNLDYHFFDASGATNITNLEQEPTDCVNRLNSYEELNNNEIVVYHDIQQGGLAIGRVKTWTPETTLPEGQFIIADAGAINSDSSTQNTLKTKVTKIELIWRNKGFDEIINQLRNRPNAFFAPITDVTLDDLKGRPYLFDLKGTDFYCYLDSEGRVNLVFKNGERDVQVSKRQIYVIESNEAVRNLERIQWVNQRINLSIYGQKVDLPVKAFANKIVVTIELDTAAVEHRGQEALDSHKVEITHALGKTYLRFDTSKLNTIGTADFNVFDIERLDIANMRASQDYLVNRQEYEINNQSMELQHRQMRFENQMRHRELLTSTIMTGIGGVMTVAGMGLGIAGTGAKLLSSALSTEAATLVKYGAVQKGMTQGLGLINKIVSLPNEWERYHQQTQVMNEQINIAIQKQQMQSYNIDLTFSRQKEDYEFNLRRTFSQQNIHQSSSRERNRALDDKETDLSGLSNIADKEIYLELWTISDKQKEYVEEYHTEYGVDCRIPNAQIAFGNGMKNGVYKLENCQLLNLNDRIDMLLIKALFENGIKIVDWIEHEKVKEYIPEDPRIAKLQKAIEDAKQKINELTHQKELLDVKIQELTVDIQNAKDEEFRLTQTIKVKEKEIADTKEKLNVATQQLEFEVEKYDSLAVGYRQLEEKKAVEERLKNLYLDEKTKLGQEKTAIQIRLTKAEGDLKQVTSTKESLEAQITTLNAQLVNIGKEKTRLTKSLQDATENRDAVIRDKENIEREFNLKKTQYEDLEREKSQIEKELRDEQAKIASLESQLERGGAEVICPQKKVDYLITKKVDDKLAITVWDSEKGIWKELPNLVIKRRDETKLLRIANENEKFETSQYPFWSYYVDQHKDKFNITVRTFSVLENYLTKTNTKQLHSWVGRYSVEIDKNIPYLDANGNWVKDYWYHPTKGWFDYEIDGASKVSNYEQYREKTVNAKDIEIENIQKELTETKDSLKALREVEQFREGKEGNRWAVTAMNEILKTIHLARAGYTYFANANSRNIVSLYGWYKNMCIFMFDNSESIIIRKGWGTNRGAWPTNYQLGMMWKLNGDSLLNYRLREFWNNSSMTDEKRSFSSSGQYSHVESLYIGSHNAIIFITEDSFLALPRINQTRLDNVNESLYLNTSLYWDTDNKRFTTTEQIGQKRISTYFEYLDFLGLKWDANKKEAVPKSLLN